MFRILIVDDEHIILNGCRLMIQEILNLPFDTEVSVANNVPEAISILDHETPDLIFVDIRMPVMDGFVLIDYVQKEQIPSSIVILTSHSDFEYARTALRYHVTDFILKPINEEELKNTILKVYAQQKALTLKQNADYYAKLLAMILYSVSSYDLLLTKEILLSLFPFTYFTIIVVNTENTTPVPEDCEQLLLQYYQACHCYYVKDRSQLICVCNHDTFSVKPANLQEQLYQLLGRKCFIGISISSNSIHQLHSLYSNACQRLFYKKAFGDNKTLTVTAGFSYQDCIRIFTEKEEVKVPEMLRNYINRLQLIENPSSIYLEQIFTSFFQNISLYLENVGLETLPQHKLMVSIPLHTIEELIQLITENLKQIKEYYASVTSDFESNRIINQLLNYIQNHYQEDISLDDISHAVNLHPNYVSSLFKKQTGQSYLSCLHRERIRAAKKLLKNSSCTIEEIAKQVGYNSSSQFARIFRKYENISPSDYRNN